MNCNTLWYAQKKIEVLCSKWAKFTNDPLDKKLLESTLIPHDIWQQSFIKSSLRLIFRKIFCILLKNKIMISCLQQGYF